MTSRGRPRKVDPEQALKIAMHVFWAKGYDGTSMSDLVEATGMAKPGIYAAFGDKEALYAKALEKYFVENGGPVIDELINSEKPMIDALHDFYQQIIDGMFDDKTPSGCFLANCVVESENDIPVLEKQSREYNDIRLAGFVKFFKKHDALGNVPNDQDYNDLAEFFSAQSLTLAVMHKSGADRQTMINVIDIALNILK